MMQKLVLIPVLFAIACLLAGLYGMLHNQVSYTVSPEYFHKFKFIQFSIPDSIPGRIGASIVGWRASWWMGIVIGTPIIFTSLIFKGWRMFFIKALESFCVVTATTLVIGLTALLISFRLISEKNIPLDWYPDISNKVAFARAGMMHDFSYLGGLIGIIAAVIYLLIAKRRQKNTGSVDMRSPPNNRLDRFL